MPCGGGGRVLESDCAKGNVMDLGVGKHPNSNNPTFNHFNMSLVYKFSIKFYDCYLQKDDVSQERTQTNADKKRDEGGRKGKVTLKKKNI